MKKDCAKIKAMKVRNFHKPEVFNRLNKKVVGAFSMALVLVATASIMGIILSNNSFAATNRFKKGKPLTKFDRIMYWPNGVMGDIDCNMNLPATTPPKCYQPIPQEYALGFINNEKTVERAVRNINVQVNSHGKTTITNNTRTAQARFLGTGNTQLYGKRSPLKFIDLFSGASYMGNLYDVRVYAYGDAKVRTYKNSVIEHYHTGGNHAASEWHFYPRNTLKVLDELYYVKEEDEVKSGPDDPCDYEKVITEKDKKTGKTVEVDRYCMFDQNAYRDANDKVVYTGVFREGSEYGPVRYTAAEMEAYLVEMENSVKLLGVENLGIFKGTVAFMDIDTWPGERYAAASGVESVFTTWNSEEYAERAKEQGSSRMVYENSYFKQMNFCQNPTPDKSCYYAWGGSTEEGKTSRETGRLWFNFSSNSVDPFVIIYSGAGHGSMIESSQFYITHILMDDLAEIPEAVVVSAQNFQHDFEDLYGHPLEEDKNFPADWKSETDRVLRFFPIYQYANYDPYTMNELLGELTEGKGLKWYSCPQMTDDCLVPYDPEHDNGKEVVGGQEYYNGYDFIDGNKTYYASMGDPIEVNFPNTCYSNNTSIKEVSNAE